MNILPLDKEKSENARVLAVEDDKLCGALIKRSLVNVCTVDIATSGEEAVEFASRTKYDLILMDIMLPGKNGVEILGEIRTIKGCEQIPVAAVTASIMKFAREYFLEIGFVNYLCKPFDPAQIRALVKECLKNYPAEISSKS